MALRSFAVTLSAYSLRPSLRNALLAFLVHRNPFYLLSALSMLAGCYALNSGLGTRTGDLGKVLALLAVLNLYEAMLIALGVYLIRRRGIVRDGRTLLLLEAPFLVDLAFLNAEMGSGSARTGCLLNLLVLALALVKTAFVLHALWGRVPRRLFAFLGLELSVLFFMPCAFARFERGGNVTLGQFYGAWWVIGLLMVVYELHSRLLGTDAGSADSGLRGFIRRLYIVLPLASAILHLSLLHWVYRVPFVVGNLAPLLLGGAFALGQSARAKRGEVKLLRAMMPLAALMLTSQSPPLWHSQWGSRLDLTPAMLILAAGYVTYVYCFFFARAVQLLAGAAAIVLLIILGPSLAQIELAILWARNCLLAGLRWLANRTAIEWGLTAVGLAFGFLALGASVSLRKEPVLQPVGPAGPS
jgi:hypothetical protein